MICASVNIIQWEKTTLCDTEEWNAVGHLLLSKQKKVTNNNFMITITLIEIYKIVYKNTISLTFMVPM